MSTINGKKVILAGGSGFCGKILTPFLAGKGWEVIILTRSMHETSVAAKALLWDGESLGSWAKELNGAEGVINLSGRSVNCRYTKENRRAILDSRILPTRVLGEAIAQCAQPPKTWLNASTATIYKHSYDLDMDENGQIAGDKDAKDEFSVEVAQEWEAALAAARTPHTRKVPMRMSMIFSAERGTVYRILRRLARFGLGGKMASGRQYVAWIHEQDYCRAVEWLLIHDELTGPFNLAAPQPLTNRAMMRIIRDAIGAPFGLPAARWMLEIGAFIMRTETELMLKSRRVVPAKIIASGFQFSYPALGEALREIETRV